MESRGTWTDLIAGVGLEIAEVFDQGQEQYQPGIFSILTKGNAERAAEKNVAGKTGAGRMRLFEDGDNIPLSRRYKTYETKIVYNNYGLGVQVTKNMIDDRDFQAELDEMKDLSIGANQSIDESGIQLFNGGFATTTEVNGYKINLYGDGKPTFSTVHPTVVPGASTQSNASSTGIKFGHDNLETARVALVQQQTDDGIALAMLGKMAIVVPTALEREATEETQSELTPESANNAINVFKGRFDVITSVFLDSVNGGSDTAWFVTIPGRDKMYHETRQAPALDKAIDPLSKTATFTVDARWANYVKDWRRKWGSKGDLAAYSS